MTAPSFDSFVERILPLSDRINAMFNEQIALMRLLGDIHWSEGWRGRDGRRLGNPMSRFVAKIEADQESSCWNWTGSMANSGYGLFGFEGKYVLAHRFSVSITRGLKGGGLVVDHVCGNKKCVNPTHLEEVTQSENVRRGIERAPPRPRATHCKKGHPFSEDNTYWFRGSRWCRTCSAARKVA
jgi:hypothetical protein